MALQDVVVRTGLDHLGDSFLANGARDADKRNVQALLAADRQGCGASQLGHRVVADNEVPLVPNKGGLHGRPSLHALEHWLKTPALKFGRDQKRIILGILHHQHSQRARHTIITFYRPNFDGLSLT